MTEMKHHRDSGFETSHSNIMKHSTYTSLEAREFYSILSAYDQAIPNLSDRLKERLPEAYLYAFSDQSGEHHTISSYRILKRWISQERYNFDDIYPVSFAELVHAIEYGIKKYKEKFHELSFLFDNKNDWDIDDAYIYINYFRRTGQDGNAVGVKVATELARHVTNKSKPYWSIWRMSLKYVTTQAKKHLYKLYSSRDVELTFTLRQRVTLTRWLYELARFPAGMISPGLLYKKIMLSQLFDKTKGPEHISSGMNEGVLYNLCFNLHASGLRTFYFGNYLDNTPRLNRSCHNSLAASKRYVEIATSITSLLEHLGNKMTAYSLKIAGESNLYMAVITNYQIIIIGIDPGSVKGQDKEKRESRSKDLLIACLQISGFLYDSEKTILCKKENGFTSYFTDNSIRMN